MTLRSFAALAAFALATLTAPAHAQIAAKPDIAYPGWDMYLGDYWPGERIKFNSRDLFARKGPEAIFREAWVFDVNATATAVFNITSTALKAPPANYGGGHFLVLYPDAGSVCYDHGCNVQLDPTPLGFLTLTENALVPRRTSLRIEDLAPGRYVFVIRGSTSSSGGVYSGQLTLRR